MQERKTTTIDRLAAYEADRTAALMQHVQAGDSLVMQWRLTAASYQYQKAQEIAHYHLHREDIVDWLDNRLKHVADNYLLTEDKNRQMPDLDGLVL
jgi:hypothetical protein